MKRVLVAGASGFIGAHAVAALADRGFEVHATSSRVVPTASGSHRADLLAPGAAEQLLGQIEPTHLLHLAWFAEPGAIWHAEENRAWVGASATLLQAFARAGGRRAVIAGTCAEYDWSYPECVEGETPLAPRTVYGESKLELASRAQTIAADSGMQVGWGRIFFLFGPGEHPARLVASVARALVSGAEAKCTRGGQVRDFLYVVEAADALAALLDSPIEGPVNIASGTGTGVGDLVRMVADAAGAPERLRLAALPERIGDPPRLVARTTQLTEEVGWHSTMALDSAVAQTVEWWRRAM